MYFDPKITLDEYEDYKVQDEINIGYDVEDDDLPDEIEDERFHAVYDPLDELFGEPISGYSLY